MEARLVKPLNLAGYVHNGTGIVWASRIGDITAWLHYMCLYKE